jgi:hypothetical protein
MKSFTKITENKEEKKTVKGTILFTDIIGSSNLWLKYSDQMYETLLKHDSEIHKELGRYKEAFIVKTIGDSFMIYFGGENSLLEAVSFAISIQTKNQNDPIKIGSDKILLRIGFAYGEFFERETIIQNKNIKDYFGTVVNIASRMESKVSLDGGFSFTSIEKLDTSVSKKIKEVLKEHCRFEVIDFMEDCRFNPDDKISRSGRLLTDIQRHKCENIELLKGAVPLRAFKVKIKKNK